jgi:hypothetical protein
MSLLFTHDIVAVSLLNEALEVHHAQKKRGLPGLLEHRVSRNQLDISGPEWAQSSNSWSLTAVSDDGFFRFKLHSRPSSRLFSAHGRLPGELKLTAVDLSAWFPELAAELLRYQMTSGILDDRGDPYSRAERIFIQVQSQATNLARMVDHSAQEQSPAGTGLVRALKPVLEEALRDNLGSLVDWIKLPGELPEHFGAALSTGRLSTDPRKLARDRLLYLPSLPLPPGPRDFGELELVVLTNGSDGTVSRRDMTGYIRDELKSTVSAAAAAAVSWSDLQRVLREDLDHFTATTRQFIESRLCAVSLVLRELGTGRAIIVSLGNISAVRFSPDRGVLEPLVYSQTISGLHRLALDLGLTEDDARRFVYQLIARKITAADFEEVSDQKVADFWDNFARRNTDALSPDSSRAGASQLHHIAIAGMGGNRQDYSQAWDMARRLAELFEQEHSERYPRGLNPAPWTRLSRSFMDINAVTLAPDERLLLGSGGFNQLVDVLSLVYAGFADLPIARMVLTRPDPQRAAEWMHMLHARLACGEDMAAVVLDSPALVRPAKDDLVRGATQRDTGTIYRRHRYGLSEDQAELSGPAILALPDEDRPLGILVDPRQALVLQTWLATPRRKRSTTDADQARYFAQFGETPFGRALSHRLTFADPFADAGRLVSHLRRTLRLTADLEPCISALPIEERLSAGDADPFLATVTLWLILRANIPHGGPVSVLLRWCSRGEGPPQPIVELARGGDIQVYDLYTSTNGTEARAFYADTQLSHPTVAYVRQPAQKARNTSPHRDRQRKRLHLIAEHTARALPAPDEDAACYARLRTDRRGRLLSETGRLLPEASAPEIRGLLTGPKG